MRRREESLSAEEAGWANSVPVDWFISKKRNNKRTSIFFIENDWLRIYRDYFVASDLSADRQVR